MLVGDRPPAGTRESAVAADRVPRTLTVLHPSLAGRYTSLVAAVAPDVEARLARTVAANRVVACSVDPPSLRLVPWAEERRAFARVLRELARTEPCLVFADVRECYPRIRPSVVEGALRGLGCGSAAAGAVRAFLVSLAQRGVRGLPVGPEASAVLANAVLAGVDEGLSAAGFKHLRWVDDIVVGAMGAVGAARALDLVRVRLQALRLELNDRKTRIVLDPSTVGSWSSVSATGRRSAVD
jgi:hypothetical protein